MNNGYLSYYDNFKKYKHVESFLCYEHPNIVKNPKVSIMIPTYKRPDILPDSISSAINQLGFYDYEVVVVDNDANGEFDLEQIVFRYDSMRLRYFRNAENIGMFGNWNRCIELARGELVTILNDDDYLDPCWLNTLLSLQKERRLVSCRTKKFKNISEISNFNGDASSSKYKELTIKNMYIGMWTNGTLGTIFHKRALLALGGFNEAFYPISDYVLCSKYILEYGGIVQNNVLSSYRIMDNESLKLSTQIGDATKCYQFREYLSDKFSSTENPSRILSLIKNGLLVKKIRISKKENSNISEYLKYSDFRISKTYATFLSFVPIRMYQFMIKFVKFRNSVNLKVF